MNVYRLAIADHPLLVDARAMLEEIPPPSVGTIPRGDFWADLEGAPPTEDRPRPHSYYRQVLHPPRLLTFPPDAALSSIVYYPPGGAGLGWHTDSKAPGWRVYIARQLGARPGSFLVSGQQQPDGSAFVERIEDEPGIALAFWVSGRPCESWHAVEALTERMSIGLRIFGYRSETARELGLST